MSKKRHREIIVFAILLIVLLLFIGGNIGWQTAGEVVGKVMDPSSFSGTDESKVIESKSSFGALVQDGIVEQNEETIPQEVAEENPNFFERVVDVFGDLSGGGREDGGEEGGAEYCGSCGECTQMLQGDNNSVFLSNDIESDGTCITIAGENVTFDCRGNTLLGLKSPSYFIDDLQLINYLGHRGIDVANKNVTIKNCNINNFDIGIKTNIQTSILDNSFTVFRSAIVLGNSGMILQNNRFTEGYIAFGSDVQESIIENNTFKHLGALMEYYGIENSLFEGNRFIENNFLIGTRSLLYSEIDLLSTKNTFVDNYQGIIGVDFDKSNYNLYDVVNFNLSLFKLDGSKCDNYIASLSTYPEESITYIQAENNITGSFAVNKKGLYSLVINYSDNEENVVYKKYNLFVDPTGQSIKKYYYRYDKPQHGQMLSSDSHDNLVLLSAPPSRNEYGRCEYWVSTTVDELPEYPISQIREINVSMNHQIDRKIDKSFLVAKKQGHFVPENCNHNSGVCIPDKSYLGVEIQDSLSLIQTQQNFTNLDWTMNNPWEWYWINLDYISGTSVMSGNFPKIKSSQNTFSYIDLNYIYSITPSIKSISDEGIEIFSATMDPSNPLEAEVILKIKENSDLTLVMPDTSVEYMAKLGGTDCDSFNPFCKLISQINGELIFNLQGEGDQKQILEIFLDFEPTTQITCSPGQIIGDINGDEVITIEDAGLLTGILNEEFLFPEDICCVDINQDGLVNEGDVTEIGNIIGLISESPGKCGDCGNTLYATCNGRYYCENGNFEYNCYKCGCSNGAYCKSGICEYDQVTPGTDKGVVKDKPVSIDDGEGGLVVEEVEVSRDSNNLFKAITGAILRAFGFG